MGFGLIFYFDIKGCVDEFYPDLAILMEEFVSEGLDLLDIWAIHQDSSEGPTYFTWTARKKKWNSWNGIRKDVSWWMCEEYWLEYFFHQVFGLYVLN